MSGLSKALSQNPPKPSIPVKLGISQSWTISKLTNLKVGQSQSWKISKLDNLKVGKFQSWKFSKYLKIGIS